MTAEDPGHRAVPGLGAAIVEPRALRVGAFVAYALVYQFEFFIGKIQVIHVAVKNVVLIALVADHAEAAGVVIANRHLPERHAIGQLIDPGVFRVDKLTQDQLVNCPALPGIGHVLIVDRNLPGLVVQVSPDNLDPGLSVVAEQFQFLFLGVVQVDSGGTVFGGNNCRVAPVDRQVQRPESVVGHPHHQYRLREPRVGHDLPGLVRRRRRRDSCSKEH